MIDVTCKVSNADQSEKSILIVKNHILFNGIVMLEIGDVRIGVKASDLIEAVNNCINTNRWG